MTASSSVVLERLSMVQVAPDGIVQEPMAFSGWLRDRRHEAGEVTELRSVTMAGATGGMSMLEQLEHSPIAPQVADLLGQSAHRGFRRRLDPLRDGSADDQALRRLLWDLPLVLMISMQAAIVDHPENPERDPMPSPLAGVNQCAGWVEGGEMITLIERRGGRLRMTPSPVLIEGALDHLGDPDPHPLPARATRRRRRLTVREVDGVLEISDEQRDSFADPDGVERALHHWIVSAHATLDDHVVTSVEVSSGALPWRECPSAAGSGPRLVGHRLDDLDKLVATEFSGITTCTHLNDTLATLSAVPELLGRPLR